MAKVKLGLKDLSLDDKLNLVQTVTKAMADNANFESPSPTLSSMTTQRTNIETKGANLEALRAQVRTEETELADLVADLDDSLRQLADYVQSTSKGDAAVIQSSGFKIASGRSSVSELFAPENLQAVTASHEGEVILRWNKVRGAGSYIVECSTSPNGPWTQVATLTRCSCKAAGLTSGTKYWFRVRSVGAAGLSPWSDPSVKMAA